MIILAFIFTSNVFASEYKVPKVDFLSTKSEIKNIYSGQWDSDFQSLVTESAPPQRNLASSLKVKDTYQEKIDYWKIESIVERNDKY